MRTLFGMFLLLSCFTAHAQRVPKDNDLARFVAPGQEDVFFSHLPKVLTAEMLGLEIFPEGTVEAAKRKYPRYQWSFSMDGVGGVYPMDPDDATEQRVLYTFGMKNSRNIAYRSLQRAYARQQGQIVGPRRLIQRLPTEDEIDYSCMPYVETGISAMRNRGEEMRSGQWWFTCAARMELQVIFGFVPPG